MHQRTYSTAQLEGLRNNISYDPVTGIFTRRSGKIVGYDHNGYVEIYHNGTRIRAHTFAWFLIHGEIAFVDHIDRDKKNNAINNLRKINWQKHLGNQNARRTNLLGVKGVQRHYRKYRAYVTYNYRTYTSKTFDTIEEAIAARQELAKQVFGGFFNG